MFARGLTDEVLKDAEGGGGLNFEEMRRLKCTPGVELVTQSEYYDSPGGGRVWVGLMGVT